MACHSISLFFIILFKCVNSLEETGLFAAAGDGSSSRRSRHSRNLDVVRRMSTSEEQSLVTLPNNATTVNMSVWIRRTLVHEMDPYLAE